MIEKHRGLLAWLGGFGPSSSTTMKSKIPETHVKIPNEVKSDPKGVKLLKDIHSHSGSVKSSLEIKPNLNSPANDSTYKTNIDMKAKRTVNQTPGLANSSDQKPQPLNGLKIVDKGTKQIMNSYTPRPALQYIRNSSPHQTRYRSNISLNRNNNPYAASLYGKRMFRNLRHPMAHKKRVLTSLSKYSKQGNIYQNQSGNDRAQISSFHNNFGVIRNPQNLIKAKNGYQSPNILKVDVAKLPRAILYPLGRCASPNVGKEKVKRIGVCRPVSQPCLANEEANAACGRYYSCCIQRNSTEPVTGDIKLQSMSLNPQMQDVQNRSKAIVYPRGKCMLTKDHQGYEKIGNCRHTQLKCLSNEEAPEICNNYLECCVASKTADKPSNNDNIRSRKNNIQSLPVAIMFPRGMCRVAGKDGMRVGSCMPATLGCVVPNVSKATSELEPVGLCPRRYNYQPKIICCAPKVTITNRNSSNFESMKIVKDDAKKVDGANAPNLENLIVPNISLL